MLKIRLKLSIDRVIVCLWIAHLLINTFSHTINIWLGGVFNMFLIWFFMLYFCFEYGKNNHNSFRFLYKKAMFCFGCFSILFIFMRQFLYDDTITYSSFGVNFSSVVWNMFSFIPQVISSLCIITKSNKEMADYIRKIVIICSMIVFSISIIYLTHDYSMAKITATGHAEYIPCLFDFSIISAFSITMPHIICYKNNKVFVWIYLSILLIGILSSSFFIAIITTLLGVFTYYILSIKKRYIRTFAFVVTVILALFMITTNFYERIVMCLVSILPYEEVTKRLLQLLVFINDGEIMATTGRLLLYKRSIMSIINHPILGNIIWDSSCFISGHSCILDVWNGCGIFVLALMLLSTKYIYCINKNFSSTDKSNAALLASTIALIFTAFFNPVFASPFIVVLWMLSPLIFNYH